MNYHLGIGGGAEVMSAADQAFPQLAVIVDLAIKNDPDRLVLVGDGLMAAFDVDDRESTTSKGYRTINVKAFIVRSTMSDRVAHALEKVFRDRANGSEEEFPRNATHDLPAPSA